MQNYEKELKSLIIEDMERLKEDVNELIKDRKANQFADAEYRSGIICPKCNNMCKSIKDSRVRQGFRIRHKVCTHCGKEWQTIEVVY